MSFIGIRVRLFCGKIFCCRSFDHFSGYIEPAAMTGAIPAFFGFIPVYNAFHVGTNRRDQMHFLPVEFPVVPNPMARASSTTTFLPALLNSKAAVKPVIPPPTIATSACSSPSKTGNDSLIPAVSFQNDFASKSIPSYFLLHTLI